MFLVDTTTLLIIDLLGFLPGLQVLLSKKGPPKVLFIWRSPNFTFAFTNKVAKVLCSILSISHERVRTFCKKKGSPWIFACCARTWVEKNEDLCYGWKKKRNKLEIFGIGIKFSSCSQLGIPKYPEAPKQHIPEEVVGNSRAEFSTINKLIYLLCVIFFPCRQAMIVFGVMLTSRR